jgi:Kef-type K+ transport system membrane component KefB
MRRGAALIFVLVVAYLVREQAVQATAIGTTALALGFTLIAATLAGELFERLRLPRVTGYLLFGLACGPFLLDIINSAMARELQLLNGLAVSLIGFIAGLEINVAAIRPRLGSVLRFSATLLGTMFVVLLGVFWLAWLVTSFSPTVTMAVVAESRAEGPFAEMSVLIVVIADLALILLFTFAMQFVRSVMGGSHEVGLATGLAWEVLGSVAFGALAGALFGLYITYVGREVTLVLIALCLVLSEVGRQLHMEAVLAALAAGLVVENVAPPQGHALKEAVERGALPVLIVFFFAAGAALELDALASIGLVAVAVSLLRLAGIRLGLIAGLRVAPLETPHSGLLWMGLVSQAGVTLGLCFIVAREFPSWGGSLETLVIGLIALHQLVGPVLMRNALVRAGEVGRLDVEPVPSDALDAERGPATAG